MHSWVRYSVAVYVGLMVAGALGLQQPRSTEGGSMVPYQHPQVVPPYPHEKYPQTWHRRATEHREETRIQGPRSRPSRRVQ